MSESYLKRAIESDWSPFLQRVQTLVYGIRPSILSTFLKSILGIQRGWITAQGVKFFVDPVSHFGQEVIRTGTYEPVFCEAVMGLLEPGDVFLDIGANEGFFSVKASKTVGVSGKVLAIEPQPELSRIIDQNAEANGLSNIKTFSLAFSDKEGSVKLSLSFSTNSGASSLFQNKVSGLRTIQVPSQKFDQWWLNQGSPQFNVVKIDCEGAELFVFRSADAALKNRFSKMICLEYHENIIGAEGVWEIDDKIRSAGYILSELYSGVWVYHLPEMTQTVLKDKTRKTISPLRK